MPAELLVTIPAPASEPTVLEQLYLDASHGGIGGTPGYSPFLRRPSTYNYNTDKANSIHADRWIREGLNSRGFSFRRIDDDEYGFPELEP